MISGQAVHGEAFNKMSSISSALNAVLECHKVITNTRMEEEERMKFINKLFEVLGDVSKESMYQPTLEGEYLPLDKGNDVGNVSHSEVSQLNQRSMEFADEKEKALLAFLHNAVSQGALVFKNENLVMQFLHDSKLVKNADVAEMLKYFSAEKEKACFDQSNKLELVEKQTGKNKVLENMGQHGPPVITRGFHTLDTDTRKASVSRSNGGSFTPGFQGNKVNTPTAGQSSSNIGGHTPFCFADTNSNRFVQNSFAKKDSIFSVKHGEKGESGLFFQNSHNKERENAFSKSSFSDIVKNDQKNFNFHGPCLFGDSVLPSHSNVPGSFNNEDSSLFRIDPKVLERRMELCSFSVVGKVTLSKGDCPWLLKKLKVRIESIWGLKSDWRLISLGKGFYHILLNSKEEWDRVWSRGHLSLKPGILRLQRWSVDFDPLKEKNSNAQVWFRIFNLPWCLWEPSVLAGIARKVGVPIRIDRATLESDLGHFARVLVDIDLAKAFRSSIHVEYGSHVFEVLLVAENIPLFCQSCHAIGHSSKECRLFTDSKNDSTKPNRQKAEANENRTNKDGSEINGCVKDQIFEVSVDKPLNPSVDHHPQPQRHNPVKRKKSTIAPEWKQKKVQAHGYVSDCNVGDSHHQHKALKATEMITDFGAQRVSNATEDHFSNSFCSKNQFSILYNLEGIEEDGIDDGISLEENNSCTTHNIIAKVPEHASAVVTHPDIPEGSISEHSVFGDIMFPKIPEKWGDLLDEEEEIDRASLPRPPRNISEIRQGIYDLFVERPSRDIDFVELDKSLFQNNAGPPIMPLSINKDKKVKIGFRHSKGSSGSSKS